MASTKLNIFQRGILQKCATVLVYMVSAATGTFFLDWLDKRLFIRLAEGRPKQILSLYEINEKNDFNERNGGAS